MSNSGHASKMVEKVIFTPEAAGDVAAAYEWYEEREPGLAGSGCLWNVPVMGKVQLLEEFRALPFEDRRQVAEAILTEEDSWIPESFRQGMEDVVAGRVMEMEKALSEAPIQQPAE